MTEVSHINRFHRSWLPYRRISHWCSPFQHNTPYKSSESCFLTHGVDNDVPGTTSVRRFLLIFSGCKPSKSGLKPFFDLSFSNTYTRRIQRFDINPLKNFRDIYLPSSQETAMQIQIKYLKNVIGWHNTNSCHFCNVNILKGVRQANNTTGRLLYNKSLRLYSNATNKNQENKHGLWLTCFDSFDSLLISMIGVWFHYFWKIHSNFEA